MRISATCEVAVSSTWLGAGLMFSNYGRWLTDSFSLSAEQLGSLSLLIGTGEVFGDFSVAVFVDRLGMYVCMQALTLFLYHVLLQYLPWSRVKQA